MKKLLLILATAAAVSASAGVRTISLVEGLAEMDRPAKVIGVRAVSTNSSGTVTLKEINSITKTSSTTVTTTNVVAKDATYSVADAMVGQRRVYTGSVDTDWLRSTSVVTNVQGSVTNVINYSLAQWCDGATTNSVVYTNQACSINVRSVPAIAYVTNIVTRVQPVYTTVPFTNTVYSGTLSTGNLSATTNLLLMGGSYLQSSGTAFAGGKVWLFLED